MRKLVACLYLFVSMACFAQSEPEVLRESKQLLVVTTAKWNSVEGRLQRYERGSSSEAWRPVGTATPIVVGKSGMAWGEGLVPVPKGKQLPSDPRKKEGDGRSPAGVFSIGTAFGQSQKPLEGSKLPYLQLTPSIECVDDGSSSHYNRIVDRASVTPDWNSSEKMLAVGEAYRWGAVVDYNGIVPTNGVSPKALGGSCIFLHVWRSSSYGTAGCTAMEKSQLEEVLRWIDPARKPLLLQLPAFQYAQMMELWRLPRVAVLSFHNK